MRSDLAAPGPPIIITPQEVDLIDHSGSKRAGIARAALAFTIAAGLELAGATLHNWEPALFAGLLAGLVGAIETITLVRDLPRVFVGFEGMRVVCVGGATVRPWSHLGPFAPSKGGVVSTWYGPNGAEIFKIYHDRDLIHLAEQLNAWRDRSLAAR